MSTYKTKIQNIESKSPMVRQQRKSSITFLDNRSQAVKQRQLVYNLSCCTPMQFDDSGDDVAEERKKAFYKAIPNPAMARHHIKELAKKRKLLPTGEASLEELGEIHAFTQHGDMFNVPLRYAPSYWTPELQSRYAKLQKGLDKLREVPARDACGQKVYRGKAYSEVDFKKEFEGKDGEVISSMKGLVSATPQIDTAIAFVDLSKKWAGEGSKVGVIFRIHSAAGVGIDDLSEWGKSMGPEVHWESPQAIQVQSEVLMNEGEFVQIGSPIFHKNIGGMNYYYIDCKEPDRKLSSQLHLRHKSVSPAGPSRKSSVGTLAREGIFPTVPEKKGAPHRGTKQEHYGTIEDRPRWKM